MNASNSQTLEDLREISSILPVKVFSYGDSSFKDNLNRVEAVYHIDNVSFADQGEYICEAFDEHGKVRKGAFLKVFNGKFYFHKHSNMSKDGTVGECLFARGPMFDYRI